MDYLIIPVTSFAQNCSLVWCNELHKTVRWSETREAALIDPGGDAEQIKLLTHGHLDHVGAAAELASFYQVPLVGPHRADEFLLQALPVQSQLFGLEYCAPLTPDCWLEEGERVKVGAVELEVLHCPGHTPGHIVFFDRAGRLLISGDVIFNGSVGRSDYPQGNHADLINAILHKLLPLGDDVTFLPGHGPASTLGRERISNPFLQ